MNELTKQDLKLATAKTITEGQNPVFKKKMELRRKIEEHQDAERLLKEWGL